MAQGEVRFPQLHDREWLRRHCLPTLEEVAQEVGCTREALRQALIRCGLPPLRGKHSPQRPRGVNRRRPALLDNREWVYRQYVLEGRSLSQIGAKLDSTGEAVANALRRFGLSRRPTGQRTLKHSLLANRRWLGHRLLNGGIATDIAAEVGCCPTQVGYWARKHGLKYMRTGWGKGEWREQRAEEAEDG